MKPFTNLYYSNKYRLTFLLLTFLFLLLFILINRSFVFLFFFVNMLYIFLMYVNKPVLLITDKALIQNGFYFKKMKINELVNIIINDSYVIFLTENDELRLNLKFLDEKTKDNLLQFISEQSLENYV